jgi:hypothetical protein
MTASFLEQMVTIYTHLGMLSSSQFIPLPSWDRCKIPLM